MSYLDIRKRIMKEFSLQAKSARFEYAWSMVGPNGETLFTDVFSIGSQPSWIRRAAIVVTSGVHGYELGAGSLAQIALMRTVRERRLRFKHPLILVHALNPWGTAYGRRNDQDNIEPNRGSGEDFTTMTEYAKYRPLVEPGEWDEDAEKRLREALVDPVVCPDLFRNVLGGQCDFPKGLFYGGRSLCRSAITLRRICGGFLAQCKNIAVLDFHTGLGADGACELLSPIASRDARGYEFVKYWFGDRATFPNIGEGESVVSPVKGDLLDALVRFLPEANVVPIALECGTGVPFEESFPLLVEENYLWFHQSLKNNRRRKVVAERLVNEVFSPPRPEWQENVNARVLELVQEMDSKLP